MVGIYIIFLYPSKLRTAKVFKLWNDAIIGLSDFFDISSANPLLPANTIAYKPANLACLCLFCVIIYNLGHEEH